MFSTKDIFWMRIGEEAIRQNIHVRCVCSDHCNLTICGPRFYVHGTFREAYGWTCLHAICREGDNQTKVPNYHENIKNWTLFWEFVREVHPLIDIPQVTIMTDQDKGSIKAVAKCIPSAFNFHCSYHRRENIIKACGGGQGKKPHTALWLYNRLSACSNMQQINAEIEKHLDKLHERDHHYLMKLDKTKQFAAARCAMSTEICMYRRSSS